MSEAGKARSDGDPVIPDKLYFRIGEVSRLLAVEPHTLRFWESEFPQLRVNKGGTGQRLYRRKDVETALEIRRLLYAEGYTIPGARQWLQSRARKRERPPELPFSPVAPASPQSALVRLRSDLRELNAMLSRPVNAADSRRPAVPPQQAARRGLHLASRSGESLSSRARGLFSSEGD